MATGEDHKMSRDERAVSSDVDLATGLFRACHI